jgi:hypothetical protein
LYFSGAKLNRSLNHIEKRLIAMAIDLTAFQAELARNSSISASVKQALDTLKGQVESLTQQLAQNGVDPATLSALADMQATLKANDDTVAAILAGTGAGGDTTGGGGADTTGGGASGADTTGGAGADTTGGAAQTPAQAPADPNAPASPSI